MSSLWPHVEYGPNDQRQDAPHFTNSIKHLQTYLASKKIFREIFGNEWSVRKLFWTQIFKTKWLDPLLAMFSDPTYWIKSKMNQNRDSISFLNTKVDQKKSTPKNNLSQTVLELWNNSVSANYSNIHLWYEKSKLYIVAYRRSDTSQWLEIIRLTFLPKNSKSQWAFLRNRGFLKLKK